MARRPPALAQKVRIVLEIVLDHRGDEGWNRHDHAALGFHQSGVGFQLRMDIATEFARDFDGGEAHMGETEWHTFLKRKSWLQAIFV